MHVCAVSASGMFVGQGRHFQDQMMAIPVLAFCSCRAPASRSPSEPRAIWEPIWRAALDPGTVSCNSTPARYLLVTIRRGCFYKACLAGATPAAAPASLELEQLRQGFQIPPKWPHLLAVSTPDLNLKPPAERHEYCLKHTSMGKRTWQGAHECHEQRQQQATGRDESWSVCEALQNYNIPKCKHSCIDRCLCSTA